MATVLGRPARPVAAVTTEDLLEQLRTGIADLASSEAWVAWLCAARKFHRYSFSNQLLIAIQCPDATHVAGYRAWQGLGRQVRKGEKGITIIAPCVHKVRGAAADGDTADEINVRITSFKCTRVFDIAQTDGDPLPEICTQLLGDDPVGAFHMLEAAATALDFTVDRVPLSGSLSGDCDHITHRIRVSADVSPMQRVKTLSHELAHTWLHAPDRVPADMPRGVKELEAESVAYIVCQEFGIDSSQYTFGYVAGWVGSGASNAISTSAQRIAQAARVILDLLQPTVERVTEGAA
jgi:antirestriction protein ArdC